MSTTVEPAPAAIHWEGDSRKVMAGFPSPVRADLGFALWQLQRGETPASPTRRMESVGSGVWELKEQDERTWYRVLYLARIDDAIYVLHRFEKRGRKTSRRDLDVARERLARVRQRLLRRRKD